MAADGHANWDVGVGNGEWDCQWGGMLAHKNKFYDKTFLLLLLLLLSLLVVLLVVCIIVAVAEGK